MAHQAFVYKDGRGFRVPAAVVGNEVARIVKRRGQCSAGALVDAARPEDSPVHPLFEWNDPVEAEKWRLHVARQVIASIRVVVESEKEPSGPPAFLPIRRVVDEDGEARDGYRPFMAIYGNPDAWQAWVRREWAHLRGDLERVRFAPEFAPLVAAIPAVEAALGLESTDAPESIPVKHVPAKAA